MLTAGEVAGLIVAMFWAILVCFLAFVLVRLARLLTETTKAVAELTDRVTPLLDDVSYTVTEANRQLVQVEAIIENTQAASRDVAKLASVTSTIFTNPLIKVSSFLHGLRGARVRRAIGGGRRR
jgi:ABC-type transporter Mla subunit MlaD